MLNGFACFWPKGYQRGSHLKGDYLKTSNANFFARMAFPHCLFLSCRYSAGSFLGFFAGSLLARSTQNGRMKFYGPWYGLWTPLVNVIRIGGGQSAVISGNYKFRECVLRFFVLKFVANLWRYTLFLVQSIMSYCELNFASFPS